MGGNQFCFKACDPAGAHAADYCQHVFDRIGCAYNAPNAAQDGVFEACEGENQDFPGIYTSNGQGTAFSVFTFIFLYLLLFLSVIYRRL